MQTSRHGLIAAAAASLALAGCSGTFVGPVESSGPVASPIITQTTAQPTPEPTADAEPGSIEQRIAAGEVLVEIPTEWGDPMLGGQVDEGYILQDFTWVLSPEGTLASAVGLTPEQGQGLSGGETFEDHVDGMVDVLTVDGTPAPTVTRSTVDGVEAARIWAQLEDRDMLVVLYIYDLDDVYYEFGYYQASGETNGGLLLARFDEVAATFSTTR